MNESQGFDCSIQQIKIVVLNLFSSIQTYPDINNKFIQSISFLRAGNFSFQSLIKANIYLI